MEAEARRLERVHVHSVYENIAPYFTTMRLCTWPRVRRFLLRLQPGSLVADVGCGDGRYLGLNGHAFTLGCDYCRPLATMARTAGHDVAVCDNLHLPIRSSCLDAVISIAVIHHFCTKQRRIRALEELARVLRPGGRMLVCVWAHEQPLRHFEKQDVLVPWETVTHQQITMELSFATQTHNSRRVQNRQVEGSHFGNTRLRPMLQRDPRKIKKMECFKNFNCPSLEGVEPNSERSSFSAPSQTSSTSAKTAHRGNTSAAVLECKHKDDVEQLERTMQLGLPVCRADGSLPDLCGTHERVSQSRHETIKGGQPPRVKVDCQDASLLRTRQDCTCSVDTASAVEMSGHSSASVSTGIGKSPPVADEVDSRCLRYYHVFREGELMHLIEKYIPDLHVLEAYYDHANWCAVTEKRLLQGKNKFPEL
uniref:tRNA methyltransferase 9B n=1 Tax=Eptatretus burgeri TaxID=7764 RepID=A0A8C4NBM4_EPTBU